MLFYNIIENKLQITRAALKYRAYKKKKSNFSCMFLNPNIFFQFEF